MKRSLYGLATLDAPESAAGLLEKTFPLSTASQSAQPDLSIRWADNAEQDLMVGQAQPDSDPFELVNDASEPSALFFYRGRGDMFLRLGKSVEMVYRRGKRAFPSRGRSHFSHLVWALRQALARRGHTLCHGAALTDGGRTLLVFGPRRARKTTLLLGLLEAGWQLIADDKFILANGHVYALEQTLTLREGHVAAFPRLARDKALSRKVRWRARLRRHVLLAAHGRLPGYLLPVVYRFLPSDTCSVPTTEAFDGIQLCSVGRVTHALVLCRRPETAVEEIALADFVDHVAPLQAMYPSQLERFSLFLEADWPDDAIDQQALLAANLAGIHTQKVAAPLTLPIADLIRTISAKL